MNKTKDAILKTIVYADVFDYPLTSEEIQRFLIRDNLQRQRHPELVSGSDQMLKKFQHDGYIEKAGEYFFLKNRKEIVDLRQKRERRSWQKLKIAEKAASFLKLIPWIKMVGVTGSLAMKNTDKEDDIDFLIIAATHRLWLTRLLTTMIIEFLGKRRHPLDKENGDKICLNMYLDDAHLAVPKKEQDLFTAHEVVQVKLLWERGEIYNKFLTENLWVKKYLPNAMSVVIPAILRQAQDGERSRTKAVIQKNTGSPIRSGMTRFLNLFEKIAKVSQLRYMKSRRTTEVIFDGIIRFHPQDARKWVLTRYQKSLKIALIRKE